MGIIDSLSAGYRFLARHLELLVLPLLLDLVLWISPRFSVEPLLAKMAQFYAQAARGELGGSSSPAEVTQVFDQMADMLTMLGKSSNLLVFLANGSLFHVPSLLATFSTLKEEHASIAVESLGPAVGLSLLVSVVGLFIGVVYLNLLARALPLGEADKDQAPATLLVQSGRQWLRTIIFLLGVLGGLAVIYIPASIGAGLLLLLSPALGSFVMVLLSGMTVVLFFYLYFVTVGLVMDDLRVWPAVVRSVTLVRHNFWITLLFILMTALISLGMSTLIGPLATAGAIGLVLASIANAFIGTGLAMALLVFYRTRILKLAEESAHAAKR